MSEIILNSKLQKSIIPSTYVRKSESISRLSERQINIISAPAGAGKSTIVSDWIDIESCSYVWYSLDTWDNEIDLFLSYLAKGLIMTESGREVGKALLQMLSSRSNLGQEGFTRTVIGLLHQITEPIIIVLDDYHVIADMNIHYLLNEMIRQMPQKLKLCIISREDPPLTLGRVRATGRICDLRMANLKFSVSESEAFLNKMLSFMTLSTDQISLIQDRTEGWIAGLQLMAQTLIRSENKDNTLLSIGASNDYIMEYLLEEVLNTFDSETQLFLLKTSIFDDFCEDLSDYALGVISGTSHTFLEILKRKNSFISSFGMMDNHSINVTWYKYHHLFRDLLRQRLNNEKSITKATIDEVYKRAGEWYENRAQYLSAIHYYFNLPLEAARLIELQWEPMDIELKSNIWLSLARRLPDVLCKRSPVISMGIGWSMLDAGDTEGCVKWFQHVEKLIDPTHLSSGECDDLLIFDQREFEQLPAYLVSAKAYIAASTGDYETLFSMKEQLKIITDTVPYQRTWVIDTFVGVLDWANGELNQAFVTFNKVWIKAKQSLPMIVQGSIFALLVEIKIQKGELIDAEQMLVEEIKKLQHPAGDGLYALYKLYQGMLYFMQGRMDQAFLAIEESQNFGVLYNHMDWQYKQELLKARIEMMYGNLESAMKCVERGKTHHFNNPIPEFMGYEDLEFWIQLETAKRENRLATFVDKKWQVFLENEKDEKIPNYLKENQYKLLFWYAPKKYHAYSEMCQLLLKRAISQKRYVQIVEFCLISIRYATSVSVQQQLLNEAEEVAKMNHIRLPFYEFSDVFVDEINASNSGSKHLLTERELDVLKLIAEGYSNQEIGASLFLSLSTIKSYNYSLFSKLDVKRRTEAVAKAKEMGIL